MGAPSKVVSASETDGNALASWTKFGRAPRGGEIRKQSLTRQCLTYHSQYSLTSDFAWIRTNHIQLYDLFLALLRVALGGGGISKTVSIDVHCGALGKPRTRDLARITTVRTGVALANETAARLIAQGVVRKRHAYLCAVVALRRRCVRPLEGALGARQVGRRATSCGVLGLVVFGFSRVVDHLFHDLRVVGIEVYYHFAKRSPCLSGRHALFLELNADQTHTDEFSPCGACRRTTDANARKNAIFGELTGAEVRRG